MSVIELAIHEPQHQQRFVEPDAVRLSGQVEDTDADDLHLEWYSSLHEPDADAPERTTLNGADDDPLDFSRHLPLGTHVLTFTARDAQELAEVTRAGMTGGADPPDDPGLLASPCVVTVLRAEVVEAALETSAVRLAARAPAGWGTPDDDAASGYTLDPGEPNTIALRWMLTLAGEETPAFTWTPNVDELEFDVGTPHEDDDPGPPRVRFAPSVPPDATGPYRVTLRIEDVEDPERWHSDAEWPELIGAEEG